MSVEAAKLLLLSSSKYRDTGYLEHAVTMIGDFLPSGLTSVLFIPFAAVGMDFDDFEAKAAGALEPLDLEVRSIHRAQDWPRAVAEAEAIAVGGGNTFALLGRLQEAGLLEAIRRAVAGGTPYIGWSAGSNVACPSICTTNDMPILQPAGFAALSLIPFQINPHFIAGKIEGHNGESREERLAEYLALNPHARVLALPEGSALRRRAGELSLIGKADAILFTSEEPKTIERGSDVSWLLSQAGEA